MVRIEVNPLSSKDIITPPKEHNLISKVFERSPLVMVAPDEIALLIGCITAPVVIYLTYILGAETGGLLKGYPGAGRDIHEKVVDSIKEVIFPHRGKRK